MKTILFLFAVFIFGLVSCNNATSDRGVVINRVRWATSNVETSGTFARSPESAGGFFTFEEAQNACPRGWRLPTYEELHRLVNAGGEWTAVNGVNGRTFGSKRNQIFLPAAGHSGLLSGMLYDVDRWGLYWSSTQGTSTYTAWSLFISSDYALVDYGSRRNILSVRCVVE